MKKIICSLAMVFLLTACSMNDVISLLVTPTAPPPPPPTEETPQPAISRTPALPGTSTGVPTFTFTPTLVRSGGSFEIPTGETLALPTLILVPTVTPGPQITFNQPGSLILSISLSTDTLFWGSCDAPKYVDFDVRVANNLRVKYVLLFLRMVDKGGNQSTPWGAGAIMKETVDNTYTYRVTKETLIHYNEFKDAWIEYQVVASTGSLKILESSPVYRNDLSLKQCLTIEVEE